MTSDNHVTGPVTDAMIEAERKYVRRLRDYRQWKITPHEIEDPEDAGRELEFAWGEAWELGWNAALAMKSKEQASVHSPDEVREFEAACLDMAKSYVLGTPESRAIITAIEHARAAIAALQHPAKEIGE